MVFWSHEACGIRHRQAGLVMKAQFFPDIILVCEPKFVLILAESGWRFVSFVVFKHIYHFFNNKNQDSLQEKERQNMKVYLQIGWLDIKHWKSNT